MRRKTGAKVSYNLDEVDDSPLRVRKTVTLASSSTTYINEHGVERSVFDHSRVHPPEDQQVADLQKQLAEANKKIEKLQKASAKKEDPELVAQVNASKRPRILDQKEIMLVPLELKSDTDSDIADGDIDIDIECSPEELQLMIDLAEENEAEPQGMIEEDLFEEVHDALVPVREEIIASSASASASHRLGPAERQLAYMLRISHRFMRDLKGRPVKLRPMSWQVIARLVQLQDGKHPTATGLRRTVQAMEERVGKSRDFTRRTGEGLGRPKIIPEEKDELVAELLMKQKLEYKYPFILPTKIISYQNYSSS